MIDGEGRSVRPPRGASDAYLTPHHVERGKLFVRHRLKDAEHLDPARIARAIELTRFPVPADDDHARTEDEAGLVRAADLIGQLGDPFYPRKLNALFQEFSETGVARDLGYSSPADVADHYPRFFWSK
ncbi:MAG: metal-dependent phosphohydrolase, partial [Solirubrobacterales bacterium]